MMLLLNSYLLARNNQRHAQRSLLCVLGQSLFEALAIRSSRNIVFLNVKISLNDRKNLNSNTKLTLGSLLIWGTLKVA